MENTTLPPRTDPAYDKLGKVQPAVIQQFLTVYNSHCEVCIDKAMIAFKGRSSMKQYVPKKLVKRSFKMWVRADAVSGYVSEIDVYTGKIPGEREYGLGGNVVRRLTRNITGHHHAVYRDNFFTSATLFKDLLEDKV